MLGMTIVICIFLFLTTALILSSIDKKYKMNMDLLEVLESFDERIKILEKRINPDKKPYFYEGDKDEKTI